MKALAKKLLPLIPFAIAVTSLFSVQPAQGFTMTINQVGSNVVATGNGAFNLTGLTFIGNGNVVDNGLNASFGIIDIAGSASVYTGFTGPASFGSGGSFFANLFSGDTFALNLGRLFVPQGYVSGAALSDSLTFNSRTFATMGLTPGTYVWTWGTGLRNQNFTLIIGGAVPDGGSTVSLLGCALLGLAALRRFLMG